MNIRVEAAAFVDKFFAEFDGIRWILFHVISGVIVSNILAKLLGRQTEPLRKIVEVVILGGINENEWKNNWMEE